MSEKIIIRPSSLNTFLQCPQQWYKVFILGENSIPNARAAIGTAIHAGAEVMWNDSIKAKTKVIAKSAMEDAAAEAWDEESQKGLRFDANEDDATAMREVRQGINTFIDDIVPWVDIPTGVEQRFTVQIDNHPIVEAVSGTLDYINENTGFLADIKTGKRKHSVADSEIQQSIYKFLAESNGVEVKGATIQNVVLKTKPEGHIMDSAINIPRAKAIVNTLLDTLDVYNEDTVDPDMLFRGNPKYYLCSPKYCNFWAKCRFVGHGDKA